MTRLQPKESCPIEGGGVVGEWHVVGHDQRGKGEVTASRRCHDAGESGASRSLKERKECAAVERKGKCREKTGPFLRLEQRRGGNACPGESTSPGTG